MNGDEEIVIEEAPGNLDTTTQEKPAEAEPSWARSMSDTMKALADRVTAPPPSAPAPDFQ